MEALYQKFRSCRSVSTDTRMIQDGDMFFALKGHNFDGNEFAPEALEKGARFAVVDDASVVKDERYLLVDDGLRALQKLATYHRNAIDARIIAITGSNGKTTTKELVYAVLSTTFKTSATQGNLNNHIGVPLTLLSISEDSEMAIVEMGANHIGEIHELCQIAQPDYGYITNFGKAHLEGFGSLEGVIQGKSELYDFLIDNEGRIFINSKDEVQARLMGNYEHLIPFNTLDDSTSLLAIDPFVRLQFRDQRINSNLTGEYNFNNISAAIAIGDHFRVMVDDIKTAVESYVPLNNRSQIQEFNSSTIVLDAYNANPTSMQAALDNFRTFGEKGRVAVLGDMFELGDAASEEHQFISDYAAGIGLEHVFLVGEYFKQTHGNEDLITRCETFDTLVDIMSSVNLDNKSVLIKGSRGMALERLLEVL